MYKKSLIETRKRLKRVNFPIDNKLLGVFFTTLRSRKEMYFSYKLNFFYLVKIQIKFLIR